MAIDTDVFFTEIWKYISKCNAPQILFCCEEQKNNYMKTLQNKSKEAFRWTT